MTNTSKQYILYIEDDPLEVLKFKYAMKSFGFDNNNIAIANNGEEGLDFLSKKPHDLPKIIVLDLKMPIMNGFEFLEVIKSNITFKRIPIIVLTSSNNKDDIIHSYDLQSSGYFVKPFKTEQYNDIILQINNYWNTSLTPSN